MCQSIRAKFARSTLKHAAKEPKADGGEERAHTSRKRKHAMYARSSVAAVATTATVVSDCCAKRGELE